MLGREMYTSTQVQAIAGGGDMQIETEICKDKVKH